MAQAPMGEAGGAPSGPGGSPPREQWGTRAGFILAAVGSAVGLGNMWRFPYLTAENGGAAFLLLYLLMVVFVGLPIMLAEFSIGRGAKKSPIQALRHFGGSAWTPLGVLFVATGFLVLSYYSVIAGWTLRYMFASLFEGFAAVDPTARFEAYAGGWDAVGWHLIFMAITITIVGIGIRRGIERAALVLIPLLLLIVLTIGAYAATLGGAGAGYGFFLRPDFGEIFSLDVLTDAAGQAFFSLSLGMGAMLTFSSYLSRDDDLPQESVIIAGSDFLIAFLAGLMVFPIIFGLGLSAEIGESTIGALYISLPGAFAEMGTAGRVFGFLFFAALVVGALTSAISLLEVVASSVIDGLGWPRKRAALGFGVLITLAGIPAAFDLNVLDIMDKIAGNVFLLLGGLFLAIFTGYVMPAPEDEVRKGAPGVTWLPVWKSFLRYVAPPLLAVVLFFTVQDTWEAIAALM